MLKGLPLIGKISDFFYGNAEDPCDNLNDEDEEELVKKIRDHDDTNIEQPEPARQIPTGAGAIATIPNVEMFKCVRKTGKITFLGSEYGLIDEVLYFERKLLPATFCAKVGDEVSFLAYKAEENQSERIAKIYAMTKDSWEKDDINQLAESSEPKTEEVPAITRKINGKVIRRKEREILIDTGNITFNLDQVDTTFVPIEGDCVSLVAVVSIDEGVTDLSGQVMEVKTVKPSLNKISIGKVTYWQPFGGRTGIGAIENEIYFRQEFCETGYVPSLGDEVIYEAIESEQGKYGWRALTVYPSEIASTPANASNKADVERAKLFQDKSGISIIGPTDFGELQIGQTKDITLEVKNFGKNAQKLIRSRFHSPKQTSQMRLMAPNQGDEFLIRPTESVQFRFSCTGKFLGLSSEIFVFYFKNFKIGRSFDMNIVMDKDMNKKMSCDIRTLFKRSFNSGQKNFLKTEAENETRTFGDKPRPAPKFLRGDKPGLYRIPDRLKQIVVGDSDMPKRTSRIMEELEMQNPFLKDDLTFQNYCDWYHLTLYLEEIALKLNFRRYDLTGVTMRRNGDFLTLQVPGLTEQRPSLIIGDKVVVSRPWTRENGAAHAGYIYEIRQKDVFLKFHSSFHDAYDESVCNVYFEASMSTFQRCHDAVNRAVKKLGPKWLFPSSVQEKSPQVIFESVEDFNEDEKTETQVHQEMLRESRNTFTRSVAECFRIINENEEENSETCEGNSGAKENLKNEPEIEDLDEEGFILPDERTKNTFGKTSKPKTDLKSEFTKPETFLSRDHRFKKKDLKWFNKSLNYHQRFAVLNILRGQGRPLPYVVFGPPGTGKTITLVETVLQLFSLLPDSRILVATPSNSAADLICERIIDAGNLRPGDIVRIVAFHRATERSICEKLVPYCTTTDLRDDKGNPDAFTQTEEGQLRHSTISTLAGRHRITVGTCSSLGAMHYMGFRQGHFSHILVDEAGQATEPELLIPITFLEPRKGQVVLTGDPEQLGPVVISKVAEEYGLGVSLLQRFVRSFPYTKDYVGFPNSSGYDPRFITRLCTNYRSIPEILELPSQLFYDTDLIPTVSGTEGREFEIVEKFDFEKETRGSPAAFIFHGVRGQNYQDGDCPSWYNPHEVWQCYLYLKQCYAIGLTADDVGIITPYKKQVQKLRSLLMELNTAIPKIGTVEDFQGQERYAIILSSVRSSLTYVNVDIKHSLGFIASPRRLNVALTRARALLIIIGNPHLLSTDPYWRSVIVYALANQSYVGCDVPYSVETTIKQYKNELENEEKETENEA